MGCNETIKEIEKTVNLIECALQDLKIIIEAIKIEIKKETMQIKIEERINKDLETAKKMNNYFDDILSRFKIKIL